MTFAGVPVRPIAAALGQPIPADQVNNVATQLTTHMSNVSSPINLLSPNAVAAKLSSTTWYITPISSCNEKVHCSLAPLRGVTVVLPKCDTDGDSLL